MQLIIFYSLLQPKTILLINTFLSYVLECVCVFHDKEQVLAFPKKVLGHKRYPFREFK
jgi:hypothetical protein